MIVFLLFALQTTCFLLYGTGSSTKLCSWSSSVVRWILIMSSKATSLETFTMLTSMHPHTEKFLVKCWKASVQILFYDILVMILLKLIYPSLLQQKCILLLNTYRENPGFSILMLGELHKPGNSSWGCWMQGTVPIPDSKIRAGSFQCHDGLCGSK